MILLTVGALFFLLGLFAGCTLVAVPLGFAPWSAGVALWVLFPVFTIMGYMMFVTAAKLGHIRVPSLILSGLLLLLAVLSAAGIILEATSIIQPAGSTLSLWYVLIVAGTIGSTGVASFTKSDGQA